MSERYSKVFSLPENLYANGSPIIIKAGALLKDNQTNTLIAQLKLHNISNKAIKFVKVQIDCLDSIGRPIDGHIEYEYLDLHVMRGYDFGTQTPIKMLNSATRAYTAQVKEVAFADNTIWHSSVEAWNPIPSQSWIESLIPSGDAHKGYDSIYGNNAKYIAKRHEDLWLCTCGEINHSNEDQCIECKNSITELESLDLDTLACEGAYLTAQSLLTENDTASIKRAKEIFESNIDYKDSADFVVKCDEKILDINTSIAKTKKNTKIMLITSGIIFVVVLLAYFVAYPFISKATGNYNVIINIYNLDEFAVPDGTLEIKNSAFYNCDSLTSVTIPDSVTSIGEDAFYSCDSLVYNEYDNAYYLGNTNNPYLVLVKAKNTSINSCMINENTKFICHSAFYSCDSLTSITIPDSVTSIGDWAFDSCDSLASLTIPNSVTSIGHGAFFDCSNLTSITIPDSVTSIGDSAFDGCDSLADVYYTGSEKEWNNITICSYNGYLTNATIHYNYVPEE